MTKTPSAAMRQAWNEQEAFAGCCVADHMLARRDSRARFWPEEFSRKEANP